MAGLQGAAAVATGAWPSPHRHTLLGTEELCTETCSVLREAVRGADAERPVAVCDVTLSEVDHHVFVQMSLASQITAEEVKGEVEQVLGVLTGAALLVTVTITRGAIIGKKENDLIRCLLLSGKPLHGTHLGYFLFLPLFKDNFTSAAVLKKLSEVTNCVMEAYFRRVNHKNLNRGQ